jgi:hypothetical protein
MKQGKAISNPVLGEIRRKNHFQKLVLKGAARTLNQWLKRTITSKRFSHPVSCHFSQVHLM